MILPEYRPFFDRLIAQSQNYVRTQCKARGSFERALSGERDANFLNDYRYYAFTKSTKSLRAIYALLEMGSYEDALILARTIMECYLSQRYFDDKFDDATLADMIVIPTGINYGALVYQNGVLQKRGSSEALSYNMRSPDDLSLGKDKNYFNDLYCYLCEVAHCNYSQAGAFLTEDGQFVMDSQQNAEAAHLFPLFIFSKLFENVVLLESSRFSTPGDEKDAVELLTDLTYFLFDKLYTMCHSLSKDSILPNHSFREIARTTMNSLKEQLGRVDKSFVSSLAKQYEETPLERSMKPVLLTSGKPSAFFEELRQNKKFSVRFPELSALIGLEQNPVYHPEGDVWTHTMQALDRAAAFRDKVSDPYAFMLLVLTHDFGKAVTTKPDEKGVLHSIGHETEGLPLIKKFLNKVTNREKIREYVLEMVPHHMEPSRYAADRSRQKATDTMFGAVRHPKDLIYMAKSDKELPAEAEAFLWERYAAFQQNA